MTKVAWISFLWFAVAVPALAQVSSGAGIAAEEIQQIREQIAALQQRLDALTRRMESSPASELPKATLSASQAASTSGQAPAEQTPVREAADGSLYGGLAAGARQEDPGHGLLGDAVKIGGYGSFRFESNNIDLGPRIANLPPVRRGFDGFDFRRLVLTLDAAPADRLRIYSEIEFERFNEMEIERTAIPENRGRQNRAGIRFIQEIEGQSGSELAMEQAWAQYDFTRGLGLRMGVILPPLGRFNIRHDDDYWDLPRRPLVDRGGPVIPVPSAWSELGAGLLGNIPVGQGYLDYRFYVMGGTRLDFSMEEVVSLRQGRNLLELEPEIAFASGPFNGTDAADALSWRFAFSPRPDREIALSGYHGRYTPDFLNARSSIHALGVDGKASWKGFEVEGEFVYTDFGRMHSVLQDIAAQAVNAAAETSSAEAASLETEVAGEFAGPLTNQRYGYWVDLKYRFWPRWLSGTFLGRGFENPQLIPILRLERIWFNDFVREFSFARGAITNLVSENLEQQRISLGLTYRPTASVALTGAYERNQRIQGSTLIFPRVLGLGGLPDKSYDALLLGMSVGF